MIMTNLLNLINVLIFFVTDTDSFYIEFLDSSWIEVVTELKDHIDFSNLPKDHHIFERLDYDCYAKQRKAQFGYVKIDTGVKKLRAFLGTKKKSYQLYLNNEEFVSIETLIRIAKQKGIPARAALKLLDKDILRLLKEPSSISAEFRKLTSRKHVVSLIKQSKSVSNSFDNSAYYRSCGLCNIPFKTTLPDEATCKSMDCERLKILVDVWYNNF